MCISKTRTLALIGALTLLTPTAGFVAEEEAPPKLLGVCTRAQLQEEPYDEWYGSGYSEYVPHSAVLAQLDEISIEPYELTIFFGTWCGDSRREVPRMLKLLDEMQFPANRVKLIAVDHVDEAYKRSPGGEEAGQEIYRVPTIVVGRDGHEVSRIVEHPVLSLERDLLAILDDRSYEPSYSTYPVVRRWLALGLLADPNVSARGLADKVRHAVSSEGELAAAGRVLQTRGQVEEAVALFRVNCTLHRESSSCQARLADALIAAGETDAARDAAERALRLNTDGERIESLVELIERTR